MPKRGLIRDSVSCWKAVSQLHGPDVQILEPAEKPEAPAFVVGFVAEDCIGGVLPSDHQFDRAISRVGDLERRDAVETQADEPNGVVSESIGVPSDKSYASS